MIKVSQPSREELRKATKAARRREKTQNRPIDFDVPMLIFINNMVGYLTQVYGPNIELKMVYDAMGYLKKSIKNYGDRFLFSPVLRKDVHFEIKTSYSSVDKKTYRITHTREYEFFDFFFLCLIDREDDFKARFYLIPKKYITSNPQEFSVTPMNGNDEVNAVNVNIEMSKTVTKEFAYEYFGKYNVLAGTDYIDWINYLNSVLFVSENQNAMVNPIVKANTKMSFMVNGKRIEEKDNRETIIKLANHIGGYTALKIFPPHRISFIEKTKTANVKLNMGMYYIDPNFNISDIRFMIMKSQSFKRLRIELM